MKKLNKIIIIMLLHAGNVVAQQDGLQVGAFTLFPTLGLSYGYNDNILLTSDAESIISSNSTVFSPGIRLEAEGEKTDFMAQYDYNKTSFNTDSKYDFEMHHVLMSLGYAASSRSRLEGTVEYSDGSDRVGTANQQGGLAVLGLDPDEWSSFGIGGKWQYGGIGAKGAIDVDIGMVDREYDNNREFTATRDRETRYIGVTYSHKATPKTRYLVQARIAKIDYDIASLDNTESRIMFGAQWQATGKTSTRALVGYLVKDFDEPQHDDFKGLAVEVGATWNLRSYSIFDLTLARETDETNGNGSYVVRNSADLGWTHFWKDRFSTTANIGVSDENYMGDNRDDSLRYYGISAKYQFSDWLMSGLGYKNFNRDSSVGAFGYRDESVMLTFEFSK